MRLVSWNVAGRVRRLDEQAAGGAAEAPGVVALQEVSRTTLPRWRPAIGAVGLAHVCSAADLHPAPVGRRGLAVLLASRWPLAVLPGPEALPWPERANHSHRERSGGVRGAIADLAGAGPGQSAHARRLARAANGDFDRAGRALRRPRHAAARASRRDRVDVRARVAWRAV